MTRKRTILFLGILLALLLVPTVLPYLIGQLLLPFWAYLLYAFFLLGMRAFTLRTACSSSTDFS